MYRKPYQYYPIQWNFQITRLCMKTEKFLWTKNLLDEKSRSVQF
jgi:hypothetical protein